MTFFDGFPRMGTATAAGDVELLGLTLVGFEAFAVREPALGRALLFEFGRILAARLREERELHGASVAAPIRIATTVTLPSTRFLVDEELRERQVAEIAETEFFKRLQSRARSLRQMTR